MAWGYWISVWVGNAAIATGAVSYTSAFAPWIARGPGASAMVTIAVVWLLTLVNCWGVRAAGWVQAVTTVLKVLPLLAVALVGGFYIRRESLASFTAVPLTLDGDDRGRDADALGAAGLRVGHRPADKVEDPERTIPRATMIGTVVTPLVCTLACSTCCWSCPAAQLAASNAPFADAARVIWGGAGAALVALFAAISAYGALNGWILLQGELPFAMARDGVFPRVFARESARHTPVFALVSTSVLVTLLVFANFHGSMAQVFTFMILLATSANLVAYLVCCAGPPVLMRRGASGRRGGGHRGSRSRAPWGPSTRSGPSPARARRRRRGARCCSPPRCRCTR